MFRKHKDSSPTSEESRSSISSSSGNQSSTSTGAPPIQSQLTLEEEFDIVKTLAEGCFAKILLAKKGSEKMVLKAIHCELSSEDEFLRELHTNYFLSPHPNILTSFNVSFIWENCFVFVQEYAPFGDLSRWVKKGGLGEAQVKLVAHQLSNALQFLHSFNLVHRDLKLENVLVFKSNLTLIKLCDFGNTRTEGSLVRKATQTWIPFSPPELCTLVPQEKYAASKGADVWQCGIILYVCLTGTAPWQVADITDPSFCQYTDWLRKRSFRLPEPFKAFTPRLIRLFKRILEPKPSQRYEIREISKYLRDDWLKKGGALSSSSSQLRLIERKESMRTSHSSNNTSRQKAIRVLGNYGLDTHVDKNLISERVHNWVKSSHRASFNSATSI